MGANTSDRHRKLLVEVKCLCGYLHTLSRTEVLDGLSVSHWKCAACKRRFVIACTPGNDDATDQFWPIYLDDVPSSGTTVEDGISLSQMLAQQSIQEVRFQCRCGCRLVGKAALLGRTCRCPQCVSRMIVRAGPVTSQGHTAPILEFLDTP